MEPSARTGQFREFPVLHLADELDTSMEAELRSIFDEFQHSGRYLIIDMSEVGYVDSSALGLVLSLDARVNAQGGALAIAGPQPAVHRVLRATGLLGMLGVFETLDAAAEFLQGRADSYASAGTSA